MTRRSWRPVSSPPSPTPSSSVSGPSRSPRASGIAALSEDEHAVGVEAILAHADIAVYTAKRAGKGSFAVYDPLMTLPGTRALQLREPLRQALLQGSVEAYFQPIVELGSCLVTGFETLARWRHDGRYVEPDVFIPIAARSGLTSALTEHMLDLACAQLARWSAELGHRRLRTGVNVSPHSIGDPGLPDGVAQYMARHGIGPGQLVLEITEDALLHDLPTALIVTRRLRDLGVVLSLDDFGAGYSSLLHLRRIPLSSVKIDRGFAGDIDTNPETEQFMRALLALGRDLELRVIVEGVERRRRSRCCGGSAARTRRATCSAGRSRRGRCGSRVAAAGQGELEDVTPAGAVTRARPEPPPLPAAGGAPGRAGRPRPVRAGPRRWTDAGPTPPAAPVRAAGQRDRPTGQRQHGTVAVDVSRNRSPARSRTVSPAASPSAKAATATGPTGSGRPPDHTRPRTRRATASAGTRLEGVGECRADRVEVRRELRRIGHVDAQRQRRRSRGSAATSAVRASTSANRVTTWTPTVRCARHLAERGGRVQPAAGQVEGVARGQHGVDRRASSRGAGRDRRGVVGPRLVAQRVADAPAGAPSSASRPATWSTKTSCTS